MAINNYGVGSVKKADNFWLVVCS